MDRPTEAPEINIREERLSDGLASHSSISIAFDVDRVLDIVESDSGLELRERALGEPYLKDYDAIEPPTNWPDRFDTANWILLAAFNDVERIGGAVVAHDTEGVDMLEGRNDLAVLWDLRVAPAWRHRGVGRRLVAASERWAARRGCRQLKIETQNINVVACRFYEAQGYALGMVDRSAYPELPDETQLLWYKDLAAVDE